MKKKSLKWIKVIYNTENRMILEAVFRSNKTDRLYFVYANKEKDLKLVFRTYSNKYYTKIVNHSDIYIAVGSYISRTFSVFFTHNSCQENPENFTYLPSIEREMPF